MTIRMIGVSMLTSFWLAGIALAQQANAVDPVLGKMGNVEVRTSEIRRLLEAQPEEVRKQISGAQELDRLVRNELIRQALLSEARSKGWDKRSDVVVLMERAREGALLQFYMSDVARPPASFPSEEDVKRTYEANKAAFTVPAQYQLAQIFIAAPETADKETAAAAHKKAADLAAKAQAKGADFAKLASANSDQKETGSKGGDLGWLPESQLLPEIRAAVIKMDKGEISAPIHSASGWHVVKLVDKKPSQYRPLSEVRDTIVSELRLRRAQEIERSYIDGMVGRNQITVNQIELSKLQSSKKQ